MAAVGVSRELFQTGDNAGSKGIKVEIPDEFQEVFFFIDHNGFVPVLEQVATPAVAPVKGPGVASQEGAHQPGEGAFACAHEQVEVVRKEDPGIDDYRSGLGQAGQAPDKILAIRVIPEDALAVEAPPHHVVQDPWRIQAWSPGHGRGQSSIKPLKPQRPLLRPCRNFGSELTAESFDFILFKLEEGSMASTSVHLPRELIASLDALAARRRVSRNHLIAEACERLVRADRGEWPQGFFTRNDLSAADLRTLRAAGKELEGILRRRRNRRGKRFT